MPSAYPTLTGENSDYTRIGRQQGRTRGAADNPGSEDHRHGETHGPDRAIVGRAHC